jgi:hypothetical protein
LSGLLKREKHTDEGPNLPRIPMTATYYQIRIACQIDPTWSERLDGLTITQTEDGTSVLSGFIRDQSELHGVLARIRDLALPLISVNPVEPDAAVRTGSEGTART